MPNKMFQIYPLALSCSLPCYQQSHEALLLQELNHCATDSCLLDSNTFMNFPDDEDLGIDYSNKEHLDRLFKDLTMLGL